MRHPTGLLLLVAAPGFATELALAQTPGIPVEEWTVPWEKSRPRDPYVAPDGRIWFVGQAGNYVARFDPTTTKFEQFAIDPGTHPHTVIVDRAGNGWYAGNRNAMIGKIDGKTGAITRFPMPDSAARDPHTMVFDGAGDIWFTVQGGNFVGKLAVRSGKIDLVKVTTPNARPYGILIDRTGRPWFDLFGTNKIGTIDPNTMALREYDLPNPRSRPRRIALTSNGMVWYGDYVGGTLGRLDPNTGAIKEWPAPSGRSSLPYAMTTDDFDRIWMVETGVQPNKLVAFDPKTEQFVANVAIPGGAGTIRHMVFDPKTGQIWFGTDNNTIGKAGVGKAAKPTA
ncbi:MAG: lyase [Gemmatimonadetes bacterium]|nr:lyase [Gemmatimonadota bacterium]